MIDRLRPLFVLCAPFAALLLSGCVAALVPLAAAGVLGKQQLDARAAKARLVKVGAVEVIATPQPDPDVAGARPTLPAASDAGITITLPAAPITGAAEGAPVGDGQSPFTAMTDWLRRQADPAQAQPDSMLLVEVVSLSRPAFRPCAKRPLAVLVDMDTRAMLAATGNDFTRDPAQFSAELRQWRMMGYSIIWISDVPGWEKQDVVSRLASSGFLSARDSDILLPKRNSGDRKQLRRAEIARQFCVKAILGDERGDFDELYSFLRKPEFAAPLEVFIGKGWFLFSPPGQ